VPAPLEIQIVGKDVTANFAIASQIAGQMRAIPGAVDVHIQHLLDQPRLQFDVDRVRIQQVGLTEQDVASNVLVSLSSSFQTQPNFWLNPASIAVQTPQYKINSLDTLRTIPVNSPTAGLPQLFENLASMARQSEPAIASHYNVQPVIDIYASTQGRDVGGVAKDVRRITKPSSSLLHCLVLWPESAGFFF
jgi:multidrug efflux pump subunit AcrB